MDRPLIGEKEHLRIASRKEAHIFLLISRPHAGGFPEDVPHGHIGEQGLISPDIRLQHMDISFKDDTDIMRLPLPEPDLLPLSIGADIAFHTIEESIHIFRLDPLKEGNVPIGDPPVLLLFFHNADSPFRRSAPHALPSAKALCIKRSPEFLPVRRSR